jgi:hypothetical protein
LITWDIVAGDFGCPYLHLIITLGGVAYIILWYRERRRLSVLTD